MIGGERKFDMFLCLLGFEIVSVPFLYSSSPPKPKALPYSSQLEREKE